MLCSELYGDLTCGGPLPLAIQNVNCYTQPTLHITHLQEKYKNSRALNIYRKTREERRQTTASILLWKQHIWTCKGRFTHSMPRPCRVAKRLDCVFPIWFTQYGRVWFALAMPCRAHAMLRPCRSSQGHSTAWSEHGMGAAWHDKCESDTATLCKSNGKGTF